MTTSEMTPADIRACTCGNDGYNNDGMFGGNGAWWIIILLLFGWGRNGYGGFGGGNGGVGENYVLATDFANIERKLDGVNNGLCDGFYAQNTNMLNGFANIQQTLCQGFNGIQQTALQGFHGVDNAICNLGYQLAQCCCDLKGAVKDSTVQTLMTGNQLDRRISDCCCDIEKMNMQNRFDAQAYNCNTLQAIDKLGDRIDSRLNAMENARVREQLDAERTRNAILQGQIDRAQLRYDIVNDVRPCPQPAYITCNPYAYNSNACCNPCGGSF